MGLALDLALHVNSASPPPFEPLAVLGGALWCTGNLAVVTIVGHLTQSTPSSSSTPSLTLILT